MPLVYQLQDKSLNLFFFNKLERTRQIGFSLLIDQSVVLTPNTGLQH